jgi:hypothetical protein
MGTSPEWKNDGVKGTLERAGKKKGGQVGLDRPPFDFFTPSP